MSDYTVRRRRRRRGINPSVIVIVFCILVTAGCLFAVYKINKPYAMLVMETGMDVPDSDEFLKNSQTGSSYRGDGTKDIDTGTVGSYELKVKNGFFTYRVTLKYEDTVKPEVSVKEIVLYKEGDELEPEDFIESIEDTTKTKVTYVTEPALDSYGYQNITLKVTDEGGNYVKVDSTLRVVDNSVNYMVEIEAGDPIDESLFFNDYSAAIDMGFSFSPALTAVDNKTVGLKQITLTLDGEEYDVTVMVNDTTPPVLSGVTDKSAYIGENNSLLTGVTATDNSTEDITVRVDSSQVDFTTEGTYTAVYSAADSSGNETTAEITVTVKKERTIDDKLDDAISAVYSEIVNDSMTDEEKAAAIYNWVYNNIAYKSGTYDYSDYKQGAIDAMDRRYGDCFSYFSISKAMLTKAGIENIDIRRISGTSAGEHFWNIVKLDGKYYHYDSCRRAKALLNGAKGYKFTDADAKAYMESSGALTYYYYYDSSLYPDIE